MKLAIALFAACLYAQSPGITDSQRIKYRELERDYYRAQLALATLQQQIVTQHDVFVRACGPAKLDEQALTCAPDSASK